MIDDFEAVMMKMEEIHNNWPLLRFCQVIELATDSIRDNYSLSDDDLITVLDKLSEELTDSDVIEWYDKATIKALRGFRKDTT